MSSLAGDISFGFVYPSCEPSTPPNYAFDPSLLEIPYHAGHARSSSRGSVYSVVSSAAESTADTVSTRMTTPSRASPPIRQHGPILLPKIRSQDQAIESPPKRVKTASPPAQVAARNHHRNSSVNGNNNNNSNVQITNRERSTFRPSHARSFTNPETVSWGTPYASQPENQPHPLSSSLLCSPAPFAPVEDEFQPRRASTCSSIGSSNNIDGIDGIDDISLGKFGFPTYRQMPAFVPAPQVQAQAQAQAQPHHPIADTFTFPSYTPRAPSPLSVSASASATPDPAEVPSTTMLKYLTAPNPAPSLVRTISFPLRDPHTKHFWWDVRQVRPWTDFGTATILGMPGASALLNCPVPATLLPNSAAPSARHPETEAALYQIHASHYLPRLNAALAMSSNRPLQLSTSTFNRSGSGGGAKSSSSSEPVFVATAQGDAASAAAMFGGKPSARCVGLVRSFDRFNTGMRVEGNVKRVEYLRGLAALHHAMREHGCRYGFILTEIEMVVVRNGAENTPHFGFLEVAVVQLAAGVSGSDSFASSSGEGEGDDECDFDVEESLLQGTTELTACLALWGLCMMAGDQGVPGQVGWRAEIGAPAEGTRRKALARDSWMPAPQLAEKREAKRSRGWVWPEDAVGRKELGKRGVRYGGC